MRRWNGIDMAEVRCIVFTDDELLRALGDFVALQQGRLPRGGFVRKRISPQGAGEMVEIDFVSDDGERRTFALTELEMRTALISFCLARRVSIPRSADKWAEFVGTEAMLVIDAA